MQDTVDILKTVGLHSVSWDALDGNGLQVSSGMYFCGALGN